MKSCPYCLAEVPAQARKCKHCGEWLDGAPEDRRAGDGDQSLGRAANRFVSLQVVMAIVGIVLALVFFFAFFLPGWQKQRPSIDDIRRGFPVHEQPVPGSSPSR